MRRRTWVLLGCCALAGLAGCTRVPERPRPYPVSGKVLLPKGEPMRGGRVVFQPKDLTADESGLEAIGEINADGTFKLTTFEKDDGAVPGVYVVTIDPCSYKTATPRRFHESEIPKSYLSRKSSPLELEVKAGPNDVGTIQLR